MRTRTSTSVHRFSTANLEIFAWSGWVFNTLDFYLENRHGIMYSNFDNAAAECPQR
jgi:hypothetical protein